MRLADFQKKFLQALYAREPEWDSLEPLFDAGGRAGLEIYRRNLIFALVGALEGTYRATTWALGRENLRFLGKRYLHANPSSDVDLTRYGGGFPEFLSTCPEIETLPWLRDLARLERAWARTARCESGLTISREEIGPLLAGEPEGSRARLGASVQLLSLDFDVIPSWKEFGRDARISSPPNKRTNWVITWMKQRRPRATELDPRLAPVVVSLAAGKTLGQIAEEAPVREDPEALRDALGAALDAGWLESLAPTEGPELA